VVLCLRLGSCKKRIAGQRQNARKRSKHERRREGGNLKREAREQAERQLLLRRFGSWLLCRDIFLRVEDFQNPTRFRRFRARSAFLFQYMISPIPFLVSDAFFLIGWERFISSFFQKENTNFIR